MSGVVTVALDAMGGDRGPAEVVAGAALAARPGVLEIVLVGDERTLAAALDGGPPPGVTTRHAGEVIGFDEEPAAAVRAKPDASMVVTARAVGEGWAQAAVSAGSTGAMLAASLFAMRRERGVIRPCLAAVLPGLHGPVTLVDAGATVDCRPEQLVQFAQMGTTLAEDVLGVQAPTCGLLTVGEEPGKGNALARETYELLVDTPGLRFLRNVEGATCSAAWSTWWSRTASPATWRSRRRRAPPSSSSERCVTRPWRPGAARRVVSCCPRPCGACADAWTRRPMAGPTCSACPGCR
jgi:glycerol-3-phosphate acyltransferase PlsX